VRSIKNTPGLLLRCYFDLDFELVQVDFLSLADPLLESAKSAGGNGEFHGSSRDGIYQSFLLEVRLERALCGKLRVTDIVASRGSFAGNCTSICHTRGRIR